MDAYFHVATIQQPPSIPVSGRESSKTGAGVIKPAKTPKTGESQTDDVLPMSIDGECMYNVCIKSSTRPQDGILPFSHLTWISKFRIPMTLERTWS